MVLRAILFDFGGTLDSDGIPWKDRFFALFAAEGAALSREAFDRAYYDSDDPLVEEDLEGVSFDETVGRLAESIAGKLSGLSSGAAARVADRFLAESRNTIARNVAALRPLKLRFRLGIVSNFYGNLERVASDTGLDEVFDAAADSVRVGSSKPDRKIFEAALQTLEVPPDEALMVGDSLRRDMAGARALGMPHLWLVGTDHPDPQPCCKGDRILRSLSELSEALS